MGNGSIINSKWNPYYAGNDSGNVNQDIDFAVSFSGYVSNVYDESATYWQMTRNTATKDFNYSPATETFKGMSSFDDYYPWKGIKKCILSPEGKVLCYEGDADFTVTPDTGDVMVEIPKFWYAIEVDNDAETFCVHISNTEREGYFVSPRHQKWGSMTKDLDYIYISAYPCNASGRSISGADLSSKNKTLYVYSSRGNVSGYYQFDFMSLLTIELLRMVECGNMSLDFNVDYIGGFSTITVPTGKTDILPWHTGRLKSSSWKYRGMENLCDGYYYNSKYTNCVPSVMALGTCLMGNILGISHNPNVIIDYVTNTGKGYKTIDETSFDYSLDLLCGRPPASLNSSDALDFLTHRKFHKRYPDQTYQDWTAFLPEEYAENKYKLHTPIGGMGVSMHYIPNDNAKYTPLAFGTDKSLLIYEGVDSYAHIDTTASSLTAHYSRLVYLPQE